MELELDGARRVLRVGDVGYAAGMPLPAQRAIASAVVSLAARCQPAWARAERIVGRLWREYEFVDEWDVAAASEDVYDVLVDGRTYPNWWTPVYISVESDGSAQVGSVSRQHFKGRLPYHLHTSSTLVRLDRPRVIEADVEGDLRGRGVWTLTPTAAGGTHVRFDWTVHADRVLLRVLTPLLRPLLRDNHNYAIRCAMRGLEPYLRTRTGSARAPESERIA